MPRVERAAVVMHGVTRNVEVPIRRLRGVAEASGVELLFEENGAVPDIAVVLGGDGTMLRALTRFLDTGVPVIGANFGRVGFLAAIPGDELERGLERVFAGEYAVQSVPTLELELGDERHVAINDAVVVGSSPGRIVEIGYAIGGEELGVQACDGLICATPLGSTAYNLSNGGPVLVWGLDAAVVTLVAPHTLHTRPLVVAPDFELEVVNRSPDVEIVVLADGHPVGTLPRDAAVTIRFAGSRTLLASLPEQTFFGRYAQVFGVG
ncbi:MAG TPA: NAD(+)/NADH kinase [Gaiellaceae bacterium]|jgi:NAD+ kinase|nr:NAD(+)/NADH kinase [Gaiellaceae bacterium]